MRRARALVQGSRAVLAAPSGPAKPARLREAARVLETWGLEVRSHVPARPKGGIPYLAASDAARARSLESAWKDSKAALILMSRGGFGAARMLPLLEKTSFGRGRPKLVAGFSDVSAILNWLAGRRGIVCFHGPNASSLAGADPATRRSLEKLLFGKTGKGAVLARGLRALRGGSASGPLAGGNLVVLSSLAGTPFAPDFSGKIVFFEDINEEIYTLDRAFTQLEQACGLSKARAVVLGNFHDRKGRKIPSRKVAELARRHAGPKAPVLYGLAVGHKGVNLTLPVGARVRVDSRSGRLTLLEDVVRD